MTEETPGSQTPQRREVLRQALEALEKMQKKLEASERARCEPIAVIGMGCRLPGGVKTPEQYWKLLAEGRDAITRMPEHRWNVAGRQVSGTAGSISAQPPWGGFLEDIDQFDANFFGISRREAESMDPQQRLLLEVGWEAIERAGIDASTLRGSKTGVFVGVTTTDYSHIALNQDPASLDAYTATGSALNVTAGRIAYVLGLNGPAMAIDTACSSSLVALHLACQSLRLGEADMALAGGVNALLKPEPFICFVKWGMMAPDGRCKTFDAAADGFVRSEGCGILLLKRLADALSAGDKILALIKGSAVNQDGASSGLTVPSGRAQEAVIAEALKAAGLSPSQVGYIEAHGTGTHLGDPIELEAIVNVLCFNRSAADPLRVGSVKTNLGHLESASGVAGLIKVILSMNHGAIPPHLHFKTLSPQINIGKAPLEIPTELVSWEYGSAPRIAGVSSFGFSGTNAHVVVEEAPRKDQSPLSERAREIICLSGRTGTALEQKARDLVEFLEREPEIGMPEASYALTAGRRHFTHRLALAGRDIRSVRQGLQDWLDGMHPGSVLSAEFVDGKARKVAYLFSGQEAQYSGMGSLLYETQPIFRKTIDHCADILKPLLDRPLLEILFTGGEKGNAISETAYTQPALFVIEYALSEMLREWGIRPSVVMGHSVGEYVAACVAGVFGLEDGLRLVAARARLTAEKTERGLMAAVFADEDAAASAIAGLEGELSIAAFNGPENVVISGRTSAMEGVLAELSRKSVRFKKLHVSQAFHSPLMEPMLQAFYREASKARFASPGITWISNVDGKPVPPGAVPDADYWCRHIRQPVNFDSSIRSLSSEECDCWLEIGPHPVLLAMARQIVPDIDTLMLPTLRRQQPDWAPLTESIAALYSRGLDINWKAFHAGRSNTAVQLPTYPFERETFWISTENKASSANATPQTAGYSRHPLLGLRVDLPSSEGIFIWQALLDMQRCTFLLDHCIQGSAIFPATAYIEMALAAAAEIQPQEAYVLRDLSFHKPLLLKREARPTLQLWMRQGYDGSFETRIFSRDALTDDLEGSKAAWILHMTGTMTLRSLDKSEKDMETFDLSSIRSRCPEEIEGTAFYESQAKRGNQWGPCFQGVHTLWRGNGEALSHIQIPSQLQGGLGDYFFHPAVADFCGHVLTATLPADDAGRREGAFVGGGIGEVRVYGSPAGRKLWSHARLRQDAQTADNVLVGDVRLWDEAGKLVSETIGARLVNIGSAAHGGETNIQDWFYKIDWVKQPFFHADSTSSLLEKQWIIMCDSNGIGEALYQQIKKIGARCIRVYPHGGFKRCGDDLWSIAADSPEDFKRFIKTIISEVSSIPSVFVHLWSLDAPSGNQLSVGQLQEAQILGCGSILHLVQALDSIENNGKIRLWLVTCGAQADGGQTHVQSIAQAPVWGIGRAIAVEHALYWGGLVDIDPLQSPTDSARQLIDSISNDNSEDQMMFRGSDCLVARLDRFNLTSNGVLPINLSSDGTYLITGGLGGIGYETARWLVRSGAKHILLTGRTSLPDRKNWDAIKPGSKFALRIERLQALESLGVSIKYIRADAGDEIAISEMRKIINTGEMPPLRGIIHAAGIMQYKPLVEQKLEDFLEVIRSKIIGGWLLHNMSLGQPLDLFILFSSASSLFNVPFMGAYLAANVFLNALAGYRHKMGLPALSVSWGAWSQTGMAAEDQRSEKRADLKGLGSIKNSEGIKALEVLLSSNASHVGVVPINWELLSRTYPDLSMLPYLERLIHRNELPPSQIEATECFDYPNFRLLDQSGKEQMVLNYLGRIIAGVLKTKPEKLSNDQSLIGFGFDSLMGVETKNRIETDCKVEIPLILLLEGQSIAQLARYLSDKLNSKPVGYVEIGQEGKGWEEGAL